MASGTETQETKPIGMIIVVDHNIEDLGKLFSSVWGSHMECGAALVALATYWNQHTCSSLDHFYEQGQRQ